MWAVIILPGTSIGVVLLWWIILTLFDAPWGVRGEAKARREAKRAAAMYATWEEDMAERQRRLDSLP